MLSLFPSSRPGKASLSSGSGYDETNGSLETDRSPFLCITDPRRGASYGGGAFIFVDSGDGIGMRDVANPTSIGALSGILGQQIHLTVK